MQYTSRPGVWMICDNASAEMTFSARCSFVTGSVSFVDYFFRIASFIWSVIFQWYFCKWCFVLTRSDSQSEYTQVKYRVNACFVWYVFFSQSFVYLYSILIRSSLILIVLVPSLWAVLILFGNKFRISAFRSLQTLSRLLITILSTIMLILVIYIVL